MKRFAFLVPFLALLLMAFSPSKNNVSISADIKGLNNDIVTIIRSPLGGNSIQQPIKDTINAKNGKFTYNITDTIVSEVYITFPKQDIDLPDGGKLRSLSRTIFLVLRPGENITIKGAFKDPDYLTYTAEGSAFNHDYAEDRINYKALQAKTDSILLLLHKYGSAKAPDSIMRPLADQYKTSLNPHKERRWTYIKQHPDADLSAYYVSMNGINAFEEQFNVLTARAKTGLFLPLFDKIRQAQETNRLKKEASETLVAGATAPDFTLKSIDGKDVTLSALKGKFVVLDFWGSWCGWCIKGMPDMRKYHDKYKDKVEFVSIACRDQDAAWRQSVKENNMTWLQLFNPSASDKHDLSVRYGIQAYPTKIIVDKDLKIVRVFVGETPDFYSALDALK